LFEATALTLKTRKEKGREGKGLGKKEAPFGLEKKKKAKTPQQSRKVLKQKSSPNNNNRPHQKERAPHTR
jgi:hypothetical protein